jgi:hypothetical protein
MAESIFMGKTKMEISMGKSSTDGELSIATFNN